MTPEKMAAKILDFEARRDRAGHLRVYKLPANDGGGTYEVAGICDKYHPIMAERLKSLIDSKKFKEAEAQAISYIQRQTDCVRDWVKGDGIQFALRDAAFNRGPTGAAKIFQMALGVSVDGIVGPRTKEAASKLSQLYLISRLRESREKYEVKVAGYRSNFWAGLLSRWDSVDGIAKFEANKII